MGDKIKKIDENFIQRLGQCVESVGNAAQLSKKTGISRPMIGDYLSGKSEPSRTKLIDIARTSGVSLEWLATGAGTKEAPKPREMIAEWGIDQASADSPNNSARKSIPLVNVAASAGGGALVYEETNKEFVSFPQPWLHQNYLSPNELFMMPTIGDSMEPTIHSGDLLLCSESEHHKKAGDGVYVVRLDGNILVKRTQVLPGKKIIVTSDNAKQFQPYEIEMNDGVDFAVIGKVVFVLKKI